MALVYVALVVGLDSWKSCLSSPDRTLCTVCLLLGICVALVRSNWQGTLSKLRVWFEIILFAVASLFLCIGLATSNSLWGGIAFGVIFAGWWVGRIRGESVSHALFLGLMFVVPFASKPLADLGCFEWLESLTITMTSLLAEAAGQPHASEDGAILFKQGIADHFSCIGVWDSLVSLFGVSLFCIVVFRRSLLAATATVAMPVLVWAALRSVACVILSYLAYSNEAWYPWTFEMELGIFLLGAALVVSLDRFFANVFKPIPFGLFNTEYWELAIAKDPDNFVVLNNLASCLVTLSESNVERSLELVSRADSLAPNNADILDTWGEVLAIANRTKEAINKFELAIRIDGKRIETRQKLIAA